MLFRSRLTTYSLQGGCLRKRSHASFSIAHTSRCAVMTYPTCCVSQSSGYSIVRMRPCTRCIRRKEKTHLPTDAYSSLSIPRQRKSELFLSMKKYFQKFFRTIKKPLGFYSEGRKVLSIQLLKSAQKSMSAFFIFSIRLVTAL